MPMPVLPLPGTTSRVKIHPQPHSTFLVALYLMDKDDAS